MCFPRLDQPDDDEVQPSQEDIILWDVEGIATSTAKPAIFPTIKMSVEYHIVQPDGETPFDGEEWRDALRKTAQEFQRRLDQAVVNGEAPPMKPSFAIKRELKFEMPDDVIDELNRDITHQLLMRWSFRRTYGGIYGDDGRLHYAITIPPIS